MRLRTFLKPLSFLPAIFMMYVIFMFSSQEADVSSGISRRASVAIVKTADYVFDLELEDWKVQDYATRIHGVTRKLAHMTEFFLLAIAVSFPLYVYGLHGILLVIVAGLICVGYACSDEYHQAFVAGRAASIKDVGIDSMGVLLGILITRIIGWTGRHTIFRPLPDERGRKQTRREIKRLKKQQKKMQQQLLSQERRYNYAPHYNKEETYPSYPPYPPYSSRFGQEPEEELNEPEADELSEDMPFSSIFQSNRRDPR